MAVFLGIDTSNYTTSAAAYDSAQKTAAGQKKPLPVIDGALGLRQSDAVFGHVKALGEVMERLAIDNNSIPTAIGVSVRPRSVQGSYMPCFLVGEMAGRTAAAAMGIPLHRFSHQEGHIAAALFATNRLPLIDKCFIALHISGGTTECMAVNGKMNGFTVSVLSATTDLHAGQAVDRVGAMLGLGFPAGPELDALAARSSADHRVKPSFVGNNPSLSGLENRCRKMIEEKFPPEDIARYCIAYLSEMTSSMIENALKRCGDLPVICAGGVMSNSIIQADIRRKFGCLFAPPALSSDNAVGVAVLAAAAEGML
jgi:N6-L-threonylcarbamoyladenine synthase